MVGRWELVLSIKRIPKKIGTMQPEAYELAQAKRAPIQRGLSPQNLPHGMERETRDASKEEEHPGPQTDDRRVLSFKGMLFLTLIGAVLSCQSS
jgi:hypothetical protein